MEDNEETIIEFQNQLSSSRRHQWGQMCLNYSRQFDDNVLDLSDLTGILVDQGTEKLSESENEDESGIKDDDQDVSDSSSNKESRTTGNNFLEISRRWTNICKRMDTSNSCAYCNFLCTQTVKELTDKSIAKDSQLSMNPSEDDLIEEFIITKDCELNKKQLSDLIIDIESNVGSALKDLGFHLDSEECKHNIDEYEKTLNQLAELKEELVFYVSVKQMCFYGFYQRWKSDKLKRFKK